MSVSCLDLRDLLVRRVHGAEVPASPQAVRDFLATRLGCLHRLVHF
ncbi:hypothetical protein [Polaromonas hydrogenivorans]|uniref:Uncharacterized protein n=1 Tax=Polaromonas hydrogenivorans TaxID=335476 RepID=A0AAU7LZY5_9BURK